MFKAMESVSLISSKCLFVESIRDRPYNIVDDVLSEGLLEILTKDHRIIDFVKTSKLYGVSIKNILSAEGDVRDILSLLNHCINSFKMEVKGDDVILRVNDLDTNVEVTYNKDSYVSKVVVENTTRMVSVFEYDDLYRIIKSTIITDELSIRSDTTYRSNSFVTRTCYNDNKWVISKSGTYIVVDGDHLQTSSIESMLEKDINNLYMTEATYNDRGQLLRHTGNSTDTEIVPVLVENEYDSDGNHTKRIKYGAVTEMFYDEDGVMVSSRLAYNGTVNTVEYEPTGNTHQSDYTSTTVGGDNTITETMVEGVLYKSVDGVVDKVYDQHGYLIASSFDIEACVWTRTESELIQYGPIKLPKPDGYLPIDIPDNPGTEVLFRIKLK